MLKPSSRLLIIGLFLLAFAFHMSVAWQEFAVLAKNGFLYDDSFYAFQIARNIAAGHGATFDGVHATNGFQPLYVFLLVPAFWAFGDNLVEPVYAALTFSAMLTALTAVLLFLITRRYVRSWIATATSLVWSFSPVVIRQSANGLETSLALFFFALVVYFYISRVRSVERPARRDFVVLGLLVGGAMLARMDEIFLALAILIDYLLLLRARRAAQGSLRRVGIAAVVALVVYSPWLAFSAVTTGSLSPDGGLATRFLSIAYAPFFNMGPRDSFDEGPNRAFVLGHVKHALDVLKIAPPTHAAFRLVEKLDGALGSTGNLIRLGNVIGIAVLALLLYIALYPRGQSAHGFGEVRFLLLFSVLFAAAYSLYVFGAFFFIRYFYPIYFVACIYCALVTGPIVRRLTTVPTRMIASIVAAGYAVVFAFMAYTSAYRSQTVYYFYDVARWVDDHTSADEIVGVFQGGAIGYLSHRHVINLDGKVNRRALDALKTRRLGEYLQKEHVDVVMDNSNVLNLFLGSDINGDRVVAYERIMRGVRDGVPGWAAYRIHGPSSGHSPLASPAGPKAPTGTP